MKKRRAFRRLLKAGLIHIQFETIHPFWTAMAASAGF